MIIAIDNYFFTRAMIYRTYVPFTSLISKLSNLLQSTMSSNSFLSFLREKVIEWIPKARKGGFKEMLMHNWYQGFTAFGGPAVHFQIVRRFLLVVLSHCLGLKTFALLKDPGIETDNGVVGG